MAPVFQCLRARFGVRFWQGFQWLALTTFACTPGTDGAGHREGAQGAQSDGQSAMSKQKGWRLAEILGRPAHGQARWGLRPGPRLGSSPRRDARMPSGSIQSFIVTMSLGYTTLPSKVPRTSTTRPNANRTRSSIPSSTTTSNCLPCSVVSPIISSPR